MKEERESGFACKEIFLRSYVGMNDADVDVRLVCAVCR